MAELVSDAPCGVVQVHRTQGEELMNSRDRQKCSKLFDWNIEEVVVEGLHFGLLLGTLHSIYIKYAKN
ncbi:hypothetical protein KIN20_026168 [Parelaphostrongylus tenuis]|uniref:Uncharacterized protein n=1 Tax=Parelaphostrongylus tenuis TaxID=148309 RepID=A0AAD5MWC3_PARTN|nr:hypothetical protein KIN20_026168 [Parelaphostrongylus tenuis]